MKYALAYRRTAFCWLVYASFYALRKLFAATKVSIMRDSYQGVSVSASVDTAFLVTYAVGQLLYSRLTRDTNVQKQLFIGLSLSAVCTVALPLSLVHSGFAVLIQLLHGLSQSVSHPAIMAFLSQVLHDHPKRATLLGVWSSSQCAGSVSSNILGAMLLPLLGWKHMFHAVGLSVLCVSLLLLNQSGTVDVISTSDAVTACNSGIKERELHMMRLLRFPGVGYTSMAFFFVKFLRYGFLLWLPFLNFNMFHYSEQASLLAATGFDFGGVAGSIFLGHLTDSYFDGDRSTATFLFLALGALCISCYIFHMSFFCRFFLACLIGVTIDGSESALGTYMVHDIVPKHLQDPGSRMVGLLTALINGIGTIGACLTGAVISIVSNYFGLQSVFMVFTAVSLIASMLTILLSRITAKGHLSQLERSRRRSVIFFAFGCALISLVNCWMLRHIKIGSPSPISDFAVGSHTCSERAPHYSEGTGLLARHQKYLQHADTSGALLFKNGSDVARHTAFVISYDPPWNANIMHLCMKHLRDPDSGDWQGPVFIMTPQPESPLITNLSHTHGATIIKAPAFDERPHEVQDKGNFKLKYLKTQLFHLLPREVEDAGGSRLVDLVVHMDSDVIAVHPVNSLMDWIACSFKLGTTSGIMTLEYAPHLVAKGELFHGGFFIFHRRQSKLLQETWAAGIRKEREATRDQTVLGKELEKTSEHSDGKPFNIIRLPLRFLTHVWRTVPEYEDGGLSPENTTFQHFACLGDCEEITSVEYNSTVCDSSIILKGDNTGCVPVTLQNCCLYLNRLQEENLSRLDSPGDTQSNISAVKVDLLPAWKPWKSGTFSNTYVLRDSNDEVYGILEKLFNARNASRVVRDKDASLVWVTYQRCGAHLPRYNSEKYWNTIRDETIIATIPGSCEDHYAKDDFCLNTRENSPASLSAEHGAVIPCWILPNHREELISYLVSTGDNWFIAKKKAEASALGTFIVKGADLAAEIKQSSKNDGMVVQRYYHDPYLFEERKSDLRVFVLIRTDPLRIYIHSDGIVWVAQLPFTMESTDKFRHFTNAKGTAPGESEYLRRGRRMSIKDFSKRYEAQRWPKFWKLLKRNVASAILTYAFHQDCETGKYQKNATRCGRFMNLYAVDCIHNRELTRLKVMEINNNPGMHQYNDLDLTRQNDFAKHVMYHSVYGDMLSLVGFNEKEKTFTPRELWEEWDHKGGYELAFPPEDLDFYGAGFDWYKGLKYISFTDMVEYRELRDHIAEQQESG